ncbi:MAG: oxygen-independent coproporphyrinogen III oxidase [Proteobacteria bacterium]|nr:oxygen-independent coproporphyrinogen III oxidase [Pseudomonadota bacterium]
MSDFARRILTRQDSTVPRYTSYPPANHFAAGEGAKLESAFVDAARDADAISLYIHIPFCDRLCWFCGCHTKHTLRYEPVKAYIDVLLQEIALWRERLPLRARISKLHLGGGSPSLLTRDDLRRLKAALDQTFTMADAEISIEIDPTDIKDGSIAALMEFGLTRASLGVQDFDPAVQKAINRLQSYEDTARVVGELRAHGVASVNIDALYGLPLQTEERLRNTIAQVISLKPERVALFGYAHVPWMKPHQKLIPEDELPDNAARFDNARMAAQMLVASGYEAIGIDHFALPQDGLAVAVHDGRLHRNFQGYTDDDAPVLIGLGPSSIGRFHGGYLQNEVATGQYTARVSAGGLPLARGLALTDDDRMRGWVIERLMCDYAFSLEELRQRFGEAADDLVDFAQQIAAFDRDGLCHIACGLFSVTPEAWPLVRIVASRFDAWLDVGTRRYSKAV